MRAATRPAIVPDAYRLLSGWCYLEHSLLRMWAGWGRHAGDWEDKIAVCHHAWLQAEVVERMRRRLAMFPGGKADQPVGAVFERLANAVLLAPSWPQAMAGVDRLRRALATAYERYAAQTHPVHDRPTLDVLREVEQFKGTQRQWYEGFRRRYPHTIQPEYAARIDAALAEAGDLLAPFEPTEPFARPCGKGTEFRLPRTPGRVKDWDRAPNVMPLIETDWSHSVEARRLFFCIGYLWEMGVAETQLTWIYYADFMPFEYVYAETRHMWDESRHGDSGRARLAEFGIDIGDVGYSSYNAHDPGVITPMTPRDVYQGFYNVTQVAETGYFETKRYCFEDFRLGDDDGSAEMMQFDIIDETSHVEYGRVWLEAMAQRAGVTDDYRQRGRADRAAAQAKPDARVRELRAVREGRLRPQAVAPGGDPTYNPAASNAAATLLDPKAQAHYQHLLRVLRDKQPLRNVATAPVRPNLPM